MTQHHLNPIDQAAIEKRITDLIEQYDIQLELANIVAKVLEPKMGQKITARFATAIQTELDATVNVGRSKDSGVRNYPYCCSMSRDYGQIYINIYHGKLSDRMMLFLGHTNDVDTLDKEVLEGAVTRYLKHEERISVLREGLKKVPALVKRYNKIRAQYEAFYEETERYDIAYYFNEVR